MNIRIGKLDNGIYVYFNRVGWCSYFRSGMYCGLLNGKFVPQTNWRTNDPSYGKTIYVDV